MRRQFYAIYLINALEGLAGSLVSVFIPIYLLQIGYPLQRVLYFFMEWNLWVCVWFFAAGFLASRVSLKQLMIVRLPMLLVYFWTLYQLPHTHFPLSLLAILNGACVAFFWFPLHIFFSKKLEGEHSEEVAKFFAYPQFVTIFAPLLGASIAVYLGYNYLFYIAGAIYLCSLAPLLWIKAEKPLARMHPRLLLEYFKRYRAYLKVEVIENMREDAEGYLWPIFIFISLGSLSALGGKEVSGSIGLVSVGIISTLAALGSIGFNLVVGKLAGKADKSKLIKIGASLTVLVWLSRYFVTNTTYFYVITLISSLAGVVLLVPLTSIMYSLAKEKVVEEFIIFREIPVALGRSLVYLIAALLAPHIENVFIVLALLFVVFMWFDFKKLSRVG